MDPMGGQPAYAPAGQQQPAGDGGVCSTCGRPLPTPDLEAVAGGIDHTLSMESGRMVPRTAWAGRAPDGMMDSLLSFMPAVKARRHLWERGQALWTERMTQAISGPCDACRGLSNAPAGGPTTAQPYSPGSDPYAQAPDPYAPGTSTPAYQQPYQPQGPPVPSEPAFPGPTGGATSVMPGYGQPLSDQTSQDIDPRTIMHPSPSTPPEEDPANATTALPAFLSHAHPSEPAAPTMPQTPSSPPPPSYDSDEHESHTVMLSVPANLRAGPRLIVLAGPVHGRQFTLGRQLTTIGRSIGCHITIESETVGYDHARVVRSEDGWRLEPLSSTGETFVNDDLVHEPQALQSGDVIRIGPARMRFESVS